MALRNQSESSEHLRLVQAAVATYQQQGHLNISADLPGFTQPALVLGTKQNHIPDVTSVSPSGRLILTEAETASTLGGGHCISQFSLFADYARVNNGEFHIVVPQALVQQAQQLVAQLGLLNTTVYFA